MSLAKSLKSTLIFHCTQTRSLIRSINKNESPRQLSVLDYRNLEIQVSVGPEVVE